MSPISRFFLSNILSNGRTGPMDRQQKAFTIYKANSWSLYSINILDLLNNLRNFQIIKFEFVDTGYDYS